MKVLGDAVLIKLLETKERKLGRFYVPGSVSTLDFGEVVSVGRGVISGGQIIAPDVQEGDIVVFNSSQKIPVEVDGVEGVEDSAKSMYLIREGQILVVVKEATKQ
jgi:co-chaperonin GroES (HSP10)